MSEKMQAQVDQWNENCPVGTVVSVRRDDGSIQLMKTRSEAQLLGGHTPVIWIEGIAGAYMLDRCLPHIVDHA